MWLDTRYASRSEHKTVDFMPVGYLTALQSHPNFQSKQRNFDVYIFYTLTATGGSQFMRRALRFVHKWPLVYVCRGGVCVGGCMCRG